MKKYTTYTLILVLFILSACGKSNSKQSISQKMRFENESAPVTMQNGAASLPPKVEDINRDTVIKKKIIKDGNLSLKVNDLERAKSAVDTLVKKYNGYFDNIDFNNSDYQSAYDLKIRIPSGNFENFINKVEGIEGEIVYKQIQARDVTDQFIDLETRLRNKRNYLKRYNELLKRAETVKDILEIEEKTRALEEEIESTEGRLNYLKDQVTYSSLNLTLIKEKPYRFVPKSHGKFTERLKRSLSGGWSGFISFVLFLIRLWPLWIILTIAIPVWKRMRNRRKSKK
jgi:hypothetical protein